MPNTVLKIHIQQQLVKLVRVGPYYGVSYDKVTNEPLDIDAGQGGDPPVSPRLVHTNEIDAQFTEDQRGHRGNIRERQSWMFVVTATFQSEATAFEAEEVWTLKPPILERTANFRQVTLNLLKTVYEHPTRQEPMNGSRINFIFEARLSRR